MEGMMSDLTERLRERAREMYGKTRYPNDFDAAADHIDRLSKALGDLIEDLDARAVTLPNGTKQVAVSDGVYHRACSIVTKTGGGNG